MSPEATDALVSFLMVLAFFLFAWMILSGGDD